MCGSTPIATPAPSIAAGKHWSNCGKRSVLCGFTGALPLARNQNSHSDQRRPSRTDS
jgi:hypothetical protein